MDVDSSGRQLTSTVVKKYIAKDLWHLEGWNRWRIRTNEELGRIFGELDIVTEIKINRVRLTGPVWEKNKRETPERMGGRCGRRLGPGSEAVAQTSACLLYTSRCV